MPRQHEPAWRDPTLKASSSATTKNASANNSDPRELQQLGKVLELQARQQVMKRSKAEKQMRMLKHNRSRGAHKTRRRGRIRDHSRLPAKQKTTWSHSYHERQDPALRQA